jgi:hypothetical protein
MVANFSEEEAMAHTKLVIGNTSRRRPTAPVYVVFDLLANQPNSVRAEHVPLTQAFQPNDLKPQGTNG